MGKINSCLNFCPICNSNNNKVLRIQKKITILLCLNCKVGFLDKNSLKIQKKINTKKTYSLKKYIFEESRLKKRFIKLADIIKKYKNEGKILDIGAGFGLFSLILSSNKKYKVNALEPINNPYFLKKTKIKFYKENIDDFFKKNKEKYDIVLLIDVLEHFENPLEKMNKIKKLLNNRGILVIQTPNYKSLMAKTCINWSWWMIEDHKLFFSSDSIDFFLKKIDMKIIYKNTYEDFYDFKKNFDGNFKNIKNSFLRKLIKFIIYIPFFGFYFLFRKLIWKLNYGGLIFIIAKK